MTIRSNITIRLPKIDKLRYIARLSNAAVIGISDSRVDKSITDSRVDKYITDSESIIVMIYYIFTEIEMKVGLLAILETTLVIHKRIYSLMILKMFSLKFICRKTNQ